MAAEAKAAIADGRSAEAAAHLGRMLAHDDLDPTLPAEALWLLAQEELLVDDLAEVAAESLGHDDPFVRSLADWAISIRVGCDNSGQEICWPKANPPRWFTRWVALDGDAVLEADYARLAIEWDIYRDGKKLLDSVDKIIARAESAAAEALRRPSPQSGPVVRRQQATLAAFVPAWPMRWPSGRKI